MYNACNDWRWEMTDSFRSSGFPNLSKSCKNMYARCHWLFWRFVHVFVTFDLLTVFSRHQSWIETFGRQKCLVLLASASISLYFKESLLIFNQLCVLQYMQMDGAGNRRSAFTAKLRWMIYVSRLKPYTTLAWTRHPPHLRPFVQIWSFPAPKRQRTKCKHTAF